jgi:dipeptidyl aminopeptidase/acylaminoacyl peptidase
VPKDADLGGPLWTADGSRFAFTNTTGDTIELWLADVRAGTTQKLAGVRLVATLGNPVQWMPDQKTLLCRVVANDAKPPERPGAPSGPVVQETSGKTAPVRTYQDLLEDAHDADLFEHYATSRLALVDAEKGTVQPLGEPGLISGASASPDGRFVLVQRLHRPFSYLVTSGSFPRAIAVIDRQGKQVASIADLPLAEGVPIEGVPLGPRSVGWIPTEDATLVWVEALDGGDPRVKVAHRDQVMVQAAPFEGRGKAWTKTEHRFRDLAVAESGELAILSEYDRERRWQRTWRVNPRDLAAAPKLLNERSAQESYKAPAGRCGA